MLDVVVVALTGAIAVAAAVMSVGLLRRDPVRIERLRAVGITSPRAPSILGLALAVAVGLLVAGWWIKPLGLIGIVAIKLMYVGRIAAYRRADRDRPHDQAGVLMTSHSLVALGLLLAW